MGTRYNKCTCGSINRGGVILKTILLLALINTATGTKTTIEVPTKDFGDCLAKKKELSQSEVPQGHKVIKFECIVGAE